MTLALECRKLHLRHTRKQTFSEEACTQTPPEFFGCFTTSILSLFMISLGTFNILTLFHNLGFTGLWLMAVLSCPHLCLSDMSGFRQFKWVCRWHFMNNMAGVTPVVWWYLKIQVCYPGFQVSHSLWQSALMQLLIECSIDAVDWQTCVACIVSHEFLHL